MRKIALKTHEHGRGPPRSISLIPKPWHLTHSSAANAIVSEWVHSIIRFSHFPLFRRRLLLTGGLIGSVFQRQAGLRFRQRATVSGLPNK